MADAIPLNMRFYRYLVESFDVLLEGQPEPIKVDPKLITSITIEKDFDEDYFPVIRLAVMLDSGLYYKILANKLTVKFRMRMQKYTYDSNSSLKFKQDVFNTVFGIYIDEDTPFLQEKTKEATDRTIGPEKHSQQVGGNECVFFLFKDKDVEASNLVINKVLSSADMTTAVTYLLANAGLSGVLMSPFDNHSSYKEVVTLPLPLLGNLEYLEAQYGFYLRGAFIFFDVDRIYFIDNNPKCTAWATGEYQKTILHIKESTNPDSLSPGSFDDSKNKNHFINIPPNNIQMDNPSVVTDLLAGNHLYVVTPAAAAVHNMLSALPQRGKGTYKFMVNRYNNLYINWAEKWKREENSRMINITLGDFDMAAFTPNKEFMFLFENAAFNNAHGGNYRITKTTFVFTKKGEEFAISGNASFKRL